MSDPVDFENWLPEWTPESTEDRRHVGLRMCQVHGKGLREEIKKRGLASLIGEDDAKIVKDFLASMEEGSTVDNFDPFTHAQFAIFDAALQFTGQVLMFLDGMHELEICPLCFLNEIHVRYCNDEECEEDFNEWIEAAADEVLATWQKLGKGDDE